MQIGGGKNYPSPETRADWITQCANESGLPIERVGALLKRYGTRAAEIARDLGPDRPLAALPDYSVEELAWIIRNERVGTLDDLLRRRTTIEISGALTPAVRDEITGLYEKIRGSAVAC